VALRLVGTGQLIVTKLTLMHPLIETHRAELLALARRRGVTGVRVFGSMSRGDGKDSNDSSEISDVDLLVTLAPGTSALALGGYLLDAQDLLGRRVDVVTEASLHPALRASVLANAVSL
jgi:predicted nucleotidyltransferase